jgi:hypothetical protein
MPGLGGLLGNPTLQQLLIWQVGAQVIGTALGPYLLALGATVNAATPNLQLSPQEAADAVLRNVWPAEKAAAEAALSGVDAERFAVLARLAGNAPDPTSLAVALRRELITPDRYLDGIRQGRLRDEWADLVRQLAVQQPSPEAMLQAYLEGQINEGEARTKYQQLGGDPAYFDILFHSEGQAPTPVQAADMANRGLIPWAGSGPDAVSFEQAFLEGPWRNKWLAPFQAAAAYLPPPRTITAMYNEGSLTHARAIELLRQQGLAPDLAAAYLTSGSSQKTAATKDLARGTIEALYRDRLLTQADARTFLEGQGYSAPEADYVLAVVDAQVAQKFLTAAVGRIHTLYIGHKIDRTTALAVLGQLGVPAATMGDVVGIWDYERAANVRTLTPAEVAQAVKKGLLDQAAGLERLAQLGYQPDDAFLYLSIHAGPLAGAPPPAGSLNPGPGV